MRKILLWILRKIPYRTRFGLSLEDELKVWYYNKYNEKIPRRLRNKCLCGGRIRTVGMGQDGWETACTVCEFIYDED